jgi:IclR family transcriptional regulator, pca regulon regulatory protein
MQMPASSANVKTGEDEQEPAWSDPDLRVPRYSQSLERGLAILRNFTAERPALGIADIADDLGMSRSTTHRYVITLLALGYLEQDTSRKYRLGLRVADLGMSALNSTGLRAHARPYLEELRESTSYTASIGVLDARDVLLVDRLRSFRATRNDTGLNLHTGSRLPPYCSSVGKLLLANLPERERHSLIAGFSLAKHGPNTITSKTALREQLEDIHEAGLAVDDQEFASGIYAIAAPVRDETQETVAAVALATHSSAISLEEFVDVLGPHLVSTAERISLRLGYSDDRE